MAESIYIENYQQAYMLVFEYINTFYQYRSEFTVTVTICHQMTMEKLYAKLQEKGRL